MVRMGEKSSLREGMEAEKGSFSVSSSRVPDPPKTSLGSIGTAKVTAKNIRLNSTSNKDIKDTKGKDIGGFTVSASRVPDLPKPDIGVVGTTKIAAKDIKTRQRKTGLALNRSESEKRAKSATVAGTSVDDGRLSRSKSAKIRSRATPTPPTSSRLNSVSEDPDIISQTINSSQNRKIESQSNSGENEDKEEENPDSKQNKSTTVQDTAKSKLRTASTSSTNGKDSSSSMKVQTSSKDEKDDNALKPVEAANCNVAKDSEQKTRKVSIESKNGSVASKDGPKPKSKSGVSVAGLIAAKAIAKDARPSTAPGKGSALLNPKAALNMTRRKPIKPKMDLAKALSMMGFGTARTLDPSGSKNARNELNAALTRKMNDFEAKRRKLLELDKQKSFVAESVRNQTKDKLRDDIRTLHEAYQFLARKYMRDEEKLKEKMNNTTTENDIQDMLDDLHLVNNFNDNEEKEEDNDVFGLGQKSSINTNADIFKIKVDRKKTM